MRRAFSQTAWGLVLALIDLRIAGFDIMPDVIGYALIIAGLAKLRAINRGFRIAWAASWLQFAFSWLPLFGIRGDISLTGGEPPAIGTLGFASLATAAELALAYGICEGIRARALEQGSAALAARAKDLWYWYFAIGAMLMVGLPFQLNYEPGEMWFPMLLFALGSFLTTLALVFLVRKAGREIGRPKEDPIG